MIDKPIPPTKKIRAGSLYIDEDNIFVTKFEDNIKVELADIIEIIDSYNVMRRSKPLLCLAIAGLYTSVTSEARIYAEKNASIAIAEAFVVNSIAQRLLTNVYMKLQRKKHPTKVFTTVEDAKEWLFNKQHAS